MGRVDEGWAWVCLVASFLTFLFISVLDSSVGTLQLALLEVYHGAVASTSVIVVTSVATMYCAAPLASFVVNATNCRACCVIGGILMFIGIASSAFVHNLNALLVTYGIITGLGKSLSGVACPISIVYNFSRRRSVASGIFVTGSGLGMFFGSPLVRFLLDYYGLAGTFLILSAIVLHVSSFGMLLRPTKYELNTRPVERTTQRRKSIAENQAYLFKDHAISFITIFKIPSYLTFGLCLFFSSIAMSVVVVHIQAFSHSTGIAKDSAANLMPFMGVGSIISRLLVGLSTSSTGLDGMVVFMGLHAVIGTLTAVFPLYAMTFNGQRIYSFLHGLYTGGMFSQLIPLTAEVVRLKLLSPAHSVNQFLMGIAWLVGPYASGYILDNNGTYFQCFYLSGGCFLLAFFLVMLTVVLKREYQSDGREHNVDSPETVPLSHLSLTAEP